MKKITKRDYRKTFQGVCGALTGKALQTFGKVKCKSPCLGRRQYQIRSRIAFWGGEYFQYRQADCQLK